jgi:adenylate cyclase
MRIGNLQRMLAYARTVQQGRADQVDADGDHLPGLPDARSQLAAPMITRGALVGRAAVESTVAIAFDDVDEHALVVVAHLVAAALEREHLEAADAEAPAPSPLARRTRGPEDERAPDDAAGAVPAPGALRLRHYAVDGSTFLDDAYVIKGVAGRLLWKLAASTRPPAEPPSPTGRPAWTRRSSSLRTGTTSRAGSSS